MAKTNRKRAMFLVGLVSNQELVGTEPTPSTQKTHDKVPEILVKSDTFKITVKSEETEDEDGNKIPSKVLYTNDKEPYEYYELPKGSEGLLAAMKYYDAKLDDDQVTFIIEALKSEETSKSVQAIVDVLNTDLKATASRSRYSKVMNDKTPITEEGRTNAAASMVRAYLRNNPGITDETAIETFHNFGVLPKSFTVKEFRANKGKR